MKRLLLAVGLLLLGVFPAASQNVTAKVIPTCGTETIPLTPGNSWIRINQQGQLCVSASVSASITGFPTVQSTGTPISVTNLGVTGTLPTGAVVVATNVGATNAAYCKLGATATTSDQYIAPNGGWFAFTVGANTQLTCITSTSTTTVNMVGGSGLPTGTGGGGGGGGGGGAVTVADGADVTQGAIADAAVTAGATGSLSAKLRSISRDVMTTNTWAGGTLGAMANYGTSPGAVLVPGVNAFVTNTLAAVANNADGVAAGAGAASPVASYNYVWNGTTWDRAQKAVLNPCEANAQTYAPISITTATTTRIVTPSASNKTYICSLFLTSAAADNVAVVEGTGGTCGTGTAGVVGGTTAANGMNFAANGGVMMQAGGKTAVAQTAGTNVDLCLITSAATPLAGGIKYVQAP